VNRGGAGERRTIRLVSPLLPAAGGATAPAPRPGSLAGVRVGLLANGKANSERLLRAIGDVLRAEHGAVIGPVVVKPHASLPAAPEVIDTFAAEVAVVLSAIGD